ncbi:MAG: hypothetical protein M1821_001697 [Bathelium mastoideum]|nr:MAG: hypothetical protein M1821_001697 [Bathelium mastoideum]KAI9691589.1 MAG: hypothetical protein M1822_007660 [Bathelium mastoideum]
MQRMQRKFGSYLPRTADEAQVGTMLHEFEEADKMLAKLIEAASAWRDAWTEILRREWSTIEELEVLYKPIIGATDNYTGGNVHIETPAEQLQRVGDLQEEYAQLKTDMQEEVNMMDTKLIQKAAEAKEHIQPLKKTIKKRQDKKLDFERYQGLVDNARKKTARSDRENTALAKHEGHLARATDEYRAADDHLKATLPQVTAAAFSILPHLLAVQIMIQNTLLAQIYTTLHNYSLNHQFQSPPPSMQDVIAAWEADFKPIQHDVETNIQSIRTGKAVRQPMTLGKESRSSSIPFRNRTPSATTTPSIRDRSSRPSLRPSPSSSAISDDASTPPEPLPTPPAVDHGSKPRLSPSPSFGPQYVMPHRLPSAGSTLSPRNGHPGSSGVSRSPLANSYASPPLRAFSASSAASAASTSTPPAATAGASATDYFSRALPSRQPTATSPPSATAGTRSGPATAQPAAAFAAAAAASKKKPPPPPPPKRPSASRWATALYDFDGGAEGDLTFSVGDRIRIVERTESTEDWWEGELRGQQGAFPANYVKVG